MSSTISLYTTVKNPLGSSHTYGYIPVHGKTLASGAEYSSIGNLVDVMQMRGEATSLRKTQSLERDLLAGRIILITTPLPVMKDDITGAIKVLDLSGGALGVVDPGWGAYTD